MKQIIALIWRLCRFYKTFKLTLRKGFWLEMNAANVQVSRKGKGGRASLENLTNVGQYHNCQVTAAQIQRQKGSEKLCFIITSSNVRCQEEGATNAQKHLHGWTTLHRTNSSTTSATQCATHPCWCKTVFENWAKTLSPPKRNAHLQKKSFPGPFLAGTYLSACHYPPSL